jgi:serine/threonine-protein kinase
MIGSTIGKYKIVAKLGRGGMGTVYKAVDETLDREVAIKVLNSEGSDAKLMARFRAEATTLARLNHPQIATIYEIYQNGDDLLMVMELVRGETFEALAIRSGPLSAEQSGNLVAQILGGLSHAHRAGIVHRDLKPANVMLTESGTVKIMDFGIARVLGAEHLTSDGTMIGTPAFMAPEQILGKDIDARADLYSTGVVFYRMVTGCLPFQADTPIGMVQKQLWDPPTPARTHREDLPLWCDPILTRALAKSPDERFQTADEFRSALLSAIGNSAERFATDSGTFTLSGLVAPAGMVPPPAPPALARDTATAGPQPGVAPTGTVPSPSTTAEDLTLISDHLDTKSASAPRPETAALAGQTAVQPMTPPAPPKSAAAAKAPPRRSNSVVVLGVAAAVVLVAVIAGATFMMRRAPASQSPDRSSAADTTAAPSQQPPEQANAADAAATAPPDASEPTAAAPAAIPAAAVGTPDASARTANAGRASSSASSPGATSRGSSSAAEVPKPLASTAITAGPAAASAPEPPAAPAGAGALLPPVTFSAQTVVVEGGRNRQRDTNVQLANGIVTVTGKDSKVMITVPYESVVGVTYSNSKQPLWNTPQGPAEVVHLDSGAFGFLKGDQNWVSLRTDSMSLVMRVRDQDSRRVINALEERLGKKVETVDDKKSR